MSTTGDRIATLAARAQHHVETHGGPDLAAAPIPRPTVDSAHIDICFDEAKTFTGLVDGNGNPTEYGQWIERPGGWILRVPILPALRPVKGKAHRGAGPTERAAAAGQLETPRSRTAKAQVLGAFITDYESGGDGLIDWDLERRFNIYLYTAAPRRGELVEEGWVRATDRVRTTPKSTDEKRSEACVWELTDAALAKLNLKPRLS